MRGWFLFSLLLIFLHSLSAQDATEFVRKADERAKGKSSYAEITIRIERPSWTRELALKAWTRGSDASLILITAPAKDKGVAFLRRKKEVWNWIPSIERNIKLPPSMMSQSWMGTDFTNDDLVKEASIVEDYTQRFSGDTVLEGRACAQITLVPKPGAAVVWGKVILSIDRKDYLLLAAEYYDEDGVLVNSLRASEVGMLGGRLLPARMEMIPADKPHNRTVLIYSKLQFDLPLQDDFFSPNRLPQLR